MRYRVFGRTGLRVSEISLGTSQTFRQAAREDEGRCARIVHEALDRGVNFFDTAPSYWEAEQALGRALKGRRHEALLATKVREEDAASARRSIERSFTHLQTDVIDLLQIHSMAGWREVTPAIQEYQRQGRVRFIGLTESDPGNYAELIEAMRTGAYDTIQILYSLAEHSCLDVMFPLAQKMGIGVIALRTILNLLADRVPLNPNAPPETGWKPKEEGAREKLREGIERGRSEHLEPYGVKTPGQALLKYVLGHPAVSTIIVATGKVERIAENAAASDGCPLPARSRRWLEGLLA
ncbi:MAG: aldo/keto reductase [Nitrospinota bacterium]